MNFSEIKYLVEHKLYVNQRDKSNVIPLYHELSKNNYDEEIVKYLIEKKSNLDVIDDSRGIQNSSSFGVEKQKKCIDGFGEMDG